MIAHLPGVVFVFDAGGRMLFWNHHLEKVTGWLGNEIQAMRPLDFFAPESRTEIERGIHSVFTHGYGEAEGELLTCQSDRKAYRFVATCVEGDAGLMAVGLGIDIEERRQAEQALWESEQRFRAVFEKAALGIAVVGRDGIPRRVNPMLERILGRSAEDLCEMRFDEFTHPEDLAADEAMFAELLAGKRKHYSIDKRFLARNGATIWADLSVSILEQRGEGSPALMLALVRDNTERVQREEQLRRAAILFENTQEGVVITDKDARIESVNAAFCRITGYTEEEVRGKNPRLLKSGYQGRAFYQAMWMSLKQHAHWEGEIWNRRKDGSIYREWLHINAVRDEKGNVTHYVGVFSDITRIREFQERVDYLAHHEPLTGLANRRLFLARLQHAFSKASHKDGLLMVGLLDLDHFKEFNNTFGYEFGDRLLQKVAENLAGAMRPVDTLASEGGNKFWLLFEEVADWAHACALAESVWQRISETYEVEGRRLDVTASLGLSCFPTDADGVEALQKNAEAAMYQVKRAGRNAFRFYTDADVAQTAQRMNLRQGLQRAIKENELVLHYQPQIDLQSGEVVALEALVRWSHPDEGLIGPVSFIPIAEEMGLITRISDWIIRAACAQGKAWLDAGIELGRIAVNLSASELRSERVAARLEEILSESGFPPDRLEIEITETSAMGTKGDINGVFGQLRQLGVGLSLDDFGTGYSSLVRLRQFPAGKLKIDKSFVADLPENEECVRIVRGIIAMAHALGLVVVAEGVESVAQRRFLVEEGCDCGQGFLWGRPQASLDWQGGSLSHR